MTVVAIVGVSSTAGQRIALFLGALGRGQRVDKILGLDTQPPKHFPGQFEFYAEDARSGKLADILCGEGVEALVHAGLASEPAGYAAAMRVMNMGGSANVLRAAEQAGVHQVVLLSSTAVYGSWADNPAVLVEDSPVRPNPDVLLAGQQAAVEALWKTFAQTHSDMICTIIRSALMIGPSVERGALFDALTHDPLLLPGNGRQMAQFVHEDDLAALVRGVLNARATGIFHAASEPLPWRMVAILAGRRAVRIPSALLPAVDRFESSRFRYPFSAGLLSLRRYSYIASGEKARHELGWIPRYTSAEALTTFVAARRLSIDHAPRIRPERHHSPIVSPVTGKSGLK